VIQLIPKLQTIVKLVQTKEELVYLVQLELTYKEVHVLEIVILVSMKPMMVNAKLVMNIVPPVKMPHIQTVNNVNLLIS